MPESNVAEFCDSMITTPMRRYLWTISLSIQDLLDDNEYGLGLSLLAGKQGLSNRVSSSRIQKPGLALAGYTEHLHPDRMQVLGNTEISYLKQIDGRVAAENVAALCSLSHLLFHRHQGSCARPSSCSIWRTPTVFRCSQPPTNHQPSYH